MWKLRPDEDDALAAFESLAPARWSENLEIVRRAIEAFSRGELESALRDADQDAVFDWTRSPGLERGVYRGHEQALRFMGTFHELFERVQVDAEEVLVGGDTVIVPTCLRVRGRYGIELETRHASLFRLRRGRIVLLPVLHESHRRAGRDRRAGLLSGASARAVAAAAADDRLARRRRVGVRRAARRCRRSAASRTPSPRPGRSVARTWPQ